jgi:hypothetical protein
MLAVQGTDEPFDRPPDLVAPLQPGAVNAVAGPVNIAAPDPFQTEKDVAAFAPDFFQFIGKRDRRSGLQVLDRAEGPLFGGPIAAVNSDTRCPAAAMPPANRFR